MKKILVINPGSTSTKIGIYNNNEKEFVLNIDHPKDELDKYDTVQDQFKMRKEVILSLLEENKVVLKNLSAVVARGGILPLVKSGAYIVNKIMIDRLKNNPVIEHASNLGALIAYEISEPLGIESYIYDSVAVDELESIARISGMVEIERASTSHALNSRAMAMKASEDLGKKYEDLNLIVTHLGGGISSSVHKKGKMIDIIADDEGPFSPERSGRVPCKKLVDLCFSGKYTKKDIQKKLRGEGGLKSYLKTHDARKVEEMIQLGDNNAKLIYEAMAYQVAKGIGELATVVEGDVDAIVITGGIAYSKFMSEAIEKRVKFIAPVIVLPGENEMEALAGGIFRVLTNIEDPRVYYEGK